MPLKKFAAATALYYNICRFPPVTVQFDGVEKSRMSPTKDLKSRPLQRHSSGCLVNTKMSSLDPSGPSVGERIDPSMPLESQLWVRHVWFAVVYISVMLFLLHRLSFAAGITEQLAGLMPSLCWGCVKRPVIWWETVRPVRTTSPSRSSKSLTDTHTHTHTRVLHQIV